MGNRAVITTVGEDKNRIGIYLHWNGGPESVLAFLQAAKQLGVRSPKNDGAYGAYCFARLTQIIANYLGGNLSIGVGTIDHLDCDNFDNGMYEIGADFEIVNRQFTTSKKMRVEDLSEEEKREYDEILASTMKANEAAYKNGSIG